MIRKSLAADSAHAFGHVSVRTGVRAARRLVDGGNTTSASGPGLDAPVWLRATRNGPQVSTFYSFDGTTWTPLATDLIAYDEAAYVGIGVTSRSSSSRATAVVSHVSVAGGRSSAPPPSGQEEINIGEPAIAGTTAYAAGTYTIVAAGAEHVGTGRINSTSCPHRSAAMSDASPASSRSPTSMTGAKRAS